MRRAAIAVMWAGLLPATAAFAAETVSLKVVAVSAATVNVRKGPSTGYSIAGVAHSGERYVVLQVSGAWAEIQFAEATGWISTGLAAVSGGSGLTGVEITALQLNVRTGPASTYAKAGQTHDGALFVQSAVSGSWRKISFGGAGRWIHGGYARTFALPTFTTKNTGSPVRPTAAVVAAISADVHRDPSAASPVLGKVYERQRYVVLTTSGTWSQIQFGHDLGWVPSTSVRSNLTSRLVRVTRLNLPVRAAASAASAWAGHAHYGQYFAWMGKNAAGDWIQICYQGVVRWVPTAGTFEDMSYFIVVAKPTANQLVSTPLYAEAKVRGWWMFEAHSFVDVLDATGRQIATVIAMPHGDTWTNDFVLITASIPFARPATQTGWVRFRADNPSDLPENENEYRVPVRFW